MPTEIVVWLPWLLLAAVAVGVLARWRSSRQTPSSPDAEVTAPVPPPPSELHWGGEYRIAIGGAGIKNVVRAGWMEEAYQVRSASPTAFESYIDFDTQQERIALTNRTPGPGVLTLSDTLEVSSPLSEGLGNRPPDEVWDIREEWMPAVNHFVKEAARRFRVSSVWPARVTAGLSSGGHGMLGLYALSQIHNEFPRADRHSHFIVPEGDVERLEAIRLLDALRFAQVKSGLSSHVLPWSETLPLALTTLVRDNRQGREELDEIAAHIAAALAARVRFDAGGSENLSNLLRRLTKRGPHSESEPCPLTFHYAEAAMPIASNGIGTTIDLATVLPIVDRTLRELRNGERVKHALDTDVGRHLILVTLPCNGWDDVQHAERYVLQRMEFAAPLDRNSIGIFFSGYRPDPANREERVLAIRLGAVAGGWDAVYRAIGSTRHVVKRVSHDNVVGRDGTLRGLKPVV
jgi:hypothetical protein